MPINPPKTEGESPTFLPLTYQSDLEPVELTQISGGDQSTTESFSLSPFPTPFLGGTEEPGNSWSTACQALLDHPPATFPRHLLGGGLVFMVAFSAWAWFGTVQEVGQARGKLVPEGETYKVQPVEMGQVRMVAVKEGQRVEAGQLMVILDADLALKEVERFQQAIQAYQVELNQKIALRERVILEAKTQQAIAAANLLVQQAAVDLSEDKQNTLKQLLQQQRQMAQAYRTRQRQRQPLTAIAQERIDQLNLEQNAHQERLKRLRSLEEDGAVSQEYLFQAEQALRETQQRLTTSQLQEVTQANEQRFQADQALRDLNVQITENAGELLKSQMENEQARATLLSQKAEAQKQQLEASRKIQQLGMEITQTQDKIKEAQNALMAAKTKLQHKYLKAPISGTILALNLKNKGEVVSAGTTIAEIAPDNAPLIVSAILPNQEAGFIKPGMPVQVKLDAYPYQDYGVISGQVIKISANAKSDQKLGEVYKVDIKLNQNHVVKNQQIIPLKPGLSVNADMIIRERRIIDVLLDPIKQMQQDGIKL